MNASMNSAFRAHDPATGSVAYFDFDNRASNSCASLAVNHCSRYLIWNIRVPLASAALKDGQRGCDEHNDHGNDA